MKQWSLNARSKGQPWPLPLGAKWGKMTRKDGTAAEAPVLAQRAAWEGPR